MAQKTNKSYSKRLRITKTGKMLSRKAGKDHFNAKKSRAKQLRGKRAVQFAMKNKNIGDFLPFK
ncbi:MAG: 50S ribosomal protein L35 [Parcubacteria group bacterium]|nr:50S ribosomal protein L35 [Parcubacteria group bacterium]